VKNPAFVARTKEVSSFCDDIGVIGEEWDSWEAGFDVSSRRYGVSHQMRRKWGRGGSSVAYNKLETLSSVLSYKDLVSDRCGRKRTSIYFAKLGASASAILHVVH